MSDVKQTKGWLSRWAGRDEDQQPRPEAPPEAPPEREPELPPGLPEERPAPEGPPDYEPGGPAEIPDDPAPGVEIPPPQGADEAPPAKAGKRGWLGGLFGRKAAREDQQPEKVPGHPDVPPEAPPEREPELPPGLPEERPAPEGPPDYEPGGPAEIPGEPAPGVEIPPPQGVSADEAVEDFVPEPLAEKPKAEGWFARLRAGLSKSSGRLTQGIADIFTKRRLDDEALEELEELLITADLGVATAARVSKRLAKSRFGKEVAPEEIRAALAEEVAEILEPVAQPLEIDRARKPHVVLVVGVNGSGKTTTIGKLAKQYKDSGLSVSLAAGDTFRAAAVEQLKVWGQRTNCPVIARDTGADAAGLAFDALADARKRGDDVLLIDTAGRLQNKAHLMSELQKVIKVIKKQDETAPHTVLLVLDATVGQNAHSQVEVFSEITNVTGLVLTKLDGTARGGVLVALAEKFAIPVHAIGVGERAEDLRPFKAEDFAKSLVGL